MELNAETRSVNEIFSPNKKYIVPRFQREYSWETEEVEEFWEDVTQQISISANKKIKNEEYFIGCIVLVGEDSNPEYLIVDGQQRLTTLTIFCVPSLKGLPSWMSKSQRMLCIRM